MRATLDALAYDLHFALRGMRRRLGFTIVVALTLAFGIGANATMFGILDRLLLRAPPHIVDPDRVVLMHARALGSTSLQTTQPYAVYKALWADVPDFADVAVATPTNVVRRTYYPLGRGANAARVAGSLVTGNYFSLLGVRPALGRFFTRDETGELAPQPLAVIGFGFWQRHFGGRLDVLGQQIELGTHKFTIVGVAPSGFTGTEPRDVDVWLPITAAEGLRLPKGADWATSGNSQWLLVIARLKPGVTVERASAQAGASYRAWLRSRLTDPTPARQARVDSQQVVLSSIIPGKSEWSFALSGSGSDVRVSKLLSGVAAIVLLIACANVANLLLVRALGRRREIAVRLALGVSRRRLVTQLVIEGLLHALLGAAGALVVAQIASSFVRRWLLGEGAWTDSAIDGRVLVFTAAIGLVTGIVASLVPALEASKPELTSALKSGSREGSVQRSRTRAVLLVAQAALAIVLLAGSGLFIRSLAKVGELDLGIDVNHALVGQISQGSVGLTNEQSKQLFYQFAERARSLPGVTASAVSIALPFSLSWGASIFVPGRELPKLRTSPMQYAITAEYFDALGIKRVMGRTFTESDRAGSALVAVINETMARMYFPARNPIGACVKVGADTAPCTTVVGVVTNTRRQDLVEGLVPQIYRPLDQLASTTTNSTVSFFGYTLVVRTSGDPSALVEPLRRAMQGVGPSVPYANVAVMRSLLGRHTRTWELGARVFTAFGALALLLAAVGLFSVVAFTVGQRMHELGVRSALGAQSADLLRLVVVRGLTPAVIGIIVGVGLALAGGRFLTTLLFEVSPRDPVVLGAASGVLFVAAFVASVIPAIRATRVEPTIALRAE